MTTNESNVVFAYLSVITSGLAGAGGPIYIIHIIVHKNIRISYFQEEWGTLSHYKYHSFYCPLLTAYDKCSVRLDKELKQPTD